MPQVVPRAARSGPLFCAEHQGSPASHLILSTGLVIPLCGACMMELGEQIAAAQLRAISPARDGWSRFNATAGR